MSNEIMVNEQSMIADLTSENLSFTSLKCETTDEKKKFYKSMNNPDYRLSDCINQKIKIKDVFVEVVNVENKETGEMTRCPRVVLIADDGKSYQSVSFGVFSAVKKLFRVFGTPTWEEPIEIKVKQITRGTNKMLTLDIE